MTGADYIHLTLSRKEWWSVHQVLKLTEQHQSTCTELNQQCRETKNDPVTVTLQVGMAWPMSNAIRPTIPEVADQLARMLGAWWWTW